jgi:ABC-type sugar transport system substrate-binding protein
MKRLLFTDGLAMLLAAVALLGATAPANAQEKKPNILFIMGDDIGWMVLS